jgi:catechol 2,3-dioxygenase-like lactoylglutathione lyase family enzyme
MSQASTNMKPQESHASGTRFDMKVEVDAIRVSDVEQSKQFYQCLGWRLDDDASSHGTFASYIHSARLEVFSRVRRGHNHSRAGLGRGNAGRLRYRSGQ